MKRKEKMVTITKQEYDSLKSTAETLSDPEAMEEIRESEKNFKKGKEWEFKY